MHSPDSTAKSLGLLKLHMPDPLPQILILKSDSKMGTMDIFNELPRCLLRGLGRRVENHAGFIVSDVANNKQGSRKRKLPGRNCKLYPGQEPREIQALPPLNALRVPESIQTHLPCQVLYLALGVADHI